MKGRVNAILDSTTQRILVQTPMPPFTALAFGAGGSAGPAEAGAIVTLEKFGVLDDIKYVSGISAGAIAALGVSLGYTAAEIVEIMKEMPMEEFMPISESWSFTPDFLAKLNELIRLASRYGSRHSLEGAAKFLAWLQSLVERKLGNGHATNQDLDAKIAADIEATGKSNLKKIYIGAINLSLDIPELVVFGSDTGRRIELAQAVFMSACHPYLWGATEWEGDLYSDGGIEQIILMSFFDSYAFHKDDPSKKNQEVLGIKIYSQKEYDALVCGKKNKVAIKTTSQAGLKVMERTLYNTSDAAEKAKPLNIIALLDAGVNRMKLKQASEKINELMAIGEVMTREYLENHMCSASAIVSYGDLPATRLAMKDETIEINCEIKLSNWHENIKRDMQRRLLLVKEKIACFNDEYQLLLRHYLHKIDEITPEFHYGWRSEEALKMLMCDAYLAQLAAERDELECKLGIKCEHHILSDLESSKAYVIFYNQMHELNKLEYSSYALRSIMLASMPIIKLKESGESPFTVQLDLRNNLDRQLYVLAMIIYLEKKLYPAELALVTKMVELFVPLHKAARENIDDFAKILNLTPIEVHKSLFKLEALLHTFEKIEYPGSTPALTIDTTFGLRSTTFFSKPLKPIPVNLLAEPKRADWDRSLRQELVTIDGNIQYLLRARQQLMNTITEYLLMCVPEEGCLNGKMYLHGAQREWVQIVAAYDEQIQSWRVDYAEIQCQLRLTCKHVNKMPAYDQQAYATFFVKMMVLNDDPAISYGLRAVMIKSLPIASFVDEYSFPFKFNLDLRVKHDREIYLIAAMIYLEWRRYHDKNRLLELFGMYFPKGWAPITSMEDLSSFLNESPADAQLSMLKIESLLHVFEKAEYPAYKPTLQLDDLVGLPKFNEITKSTVEPNAVGSEMKPIYFFSEQRPPRNFVAPMAAYTENHDHEEGDSDICQLMKQRKMD